MNEQNHEPGIEAAVLRCGFRLGYYSRRHIERWAEIQIEKQGQPSLDLIELAILKGKNDWDVLSLLARIAPEASPQVELETSIGFVGKLYRTGKCSLESSIRTLLSMASENRFLGVMAQEFADMYFLDDTYDLAIRGIKKIEDVESQFLTFVEPYVTALDDADSRIAELANT